MQPVSEKLFNDSLDNVYNRYSPMLYSIALEISPTQIEAEEILIVTFIKMHKQKLIVQHHASICLMLIKLLMQTANELLKQKEHIKLTQFENTPLLHQILCGCITMKEICRERKLTREAAAKIIREEIRGLIKTTEKETIAHL